MRESILHRPKREDVLAHLPAVRRDSFLVDACVSGVSAQEATDAFAGEDPEVLEGPVFAEARRRLGEAKAQAAAEYLGVLCDGGDRPLIWCWHQSTAEALSRLLEVPFVHGGVPDTRRKALVAEFVLGRHAALILTIAAAGTGLDGLQHATDLAVFVERHYVPAENEQAEARILRTGQQNPVRFIVIHATDPMDRALDASLRQKARIFQEIHQ